MKNLRPFAIDFMSVSGAPRSKFVNIGFHFHNSLSPTLEMFEAMFNVAEPFGKSIRTKFQKMINKISSFKHLLNDLAAEQTSLLTSLPGTRTQKPLDIFAGVTGALPFL